MARLMCGRCVGFHGESDVHPPPIRRILTNSPTMRNIHEFHIAHSRVSRRETPPPFPSHLSTQQVRDLLSTPLPASHSALFPEHTKTPIATSNPYHKPATLTQRHRLINNPPSSLVHHPQLLIGNRRRPFR